MPADHIADVHLLTCKSLLDDGLRDAVKPGARIAITAGSQCMGGFVELLEGIADAVKSVGGQPFLIPAMGSHGDATSEGQTEILYRLGATEEAVGAPIRACSTLPAPTFPPSRLTISICSLWTKSARTLPGPAWI